MDQGTTDNEQILSPNNLNGEKSDERYQINAEFQDEFLKAITINPLSSGTLELQGVIVSLDGKNKKNGEDALPDDSINKEDIVSDVLENEAELPNTTDYKHIFVEENATVNKHSTQHTTRNKDTINEHLTQDTTRNKDFTEPYNACMDVQPRPFKCPECQRFYAETEEKLLRHIKRKHRGENPFSCFMCEYSTYNKTLFEEHVRIHQGIKPFKCSHCDYATVSKRYIKKHEMRHRSDNPLRCQNCKYIAKTKTHLTSHVHKKHNLAQNIKTSISEEHTASHSLSNVNKCSVCRYETTDDRAFKKHKHEHKYIKCEFCDFKSKSRALSNKHKLKHKLEHKLTSQGKVRKAKFTCKICKWESNTEMRILLHLIHHPSQKVESGIVDLKVLKKHGILQD